MATPMRVVSVVYSSHCAYSQGYCPWKWMSLRTKLWTLVLALAIEAQFMNLMCYGGPDTINWSYILPDNGRVIHIPTNKQG